MHWRRKWQPTPVFLPGESQGRGAWWAAVYGVAQSRARLKRLSSSSSSSRINMEAQDPLRDPSVCLLHHPQCVFYPQGHLMGQDGNWSSTLQICFSPPGRSRIKTKGQKKDPSQLSQLLFTVYISTARSARPYLATSELGNVIFICSINVPNSRLKKGLCL